MTNLTGREICVFSYLCEYFKRNDQLPSCEAMAKHFGWASPNAAQDYFDRLKRKGVVEKNDSKKWRFKTIERFELTPPPLGMTYRTRLRPKPVLWPVFTERLSA